ncbi:MAG: oligosaccharide flippase family protein [Actinomycetes bacterium]
MNRGQSLGSVTRRGARASLAAQLVTQLGSVAATVILARVLTPTEFGIVAVSQSVLGAAALLTLGGITAALVTRPRDLAMAAQSYFLLSAGLGLFGVAAFAASAQPLTAVLGQPDAAPFLAVLSVSFLLSTVAIVPAAILQRRMRFGWLSFSSIAGAGVYFGVEIALAMAGFGAWAVVLGQVAGSVVTLAVVFIGARWRPRLRLSVTLIRADISTLSGLSAGQVLSYFQKNIDYWVVSAQIGASNLGAYYVAYVLPSVVRLRLSHVLRQVMLPAFSISGSGAQTQMLWRRSFAVLLGIGLPLLVGVAVIADPLVALFFGGQWQDAVEPMRVLALAAIADLWLTSVGTVAIAQNLVRPYLLTLGVRAGTTTIFAILAGVIWGTTSAVAWAVAASALVTLFVQEVALARPLGIGIQSVFRPVSWYVGLCVAMAVCSILALQLLGDRASPAVQVLTGAVVGSTAYAGLGLLLARDVMKSVMADGFLVLRGR